jgi:hypothetical protein
MGKKQRNLILSVLAVITAYDLFTTITGTIEILGTDLGSVIASVTLSVIIAGFLYYSYEIQQVDRNEFLPSMVKPLWFLSYIFDFYTSFTGNNRFIVQSDINFSGIIKGNAEVGVLESYIGEITILVGLTIFVSSCPIILSYLRNSAYFMGGQKI